MKIYQVTAISHRDVDSYDRKDIAHLITTPHDLFATLMGAVYSVVDAANEERKGQWEEIHGPYAAIGCRPVGLIEWDIDVPDAPDAPDSPAPKAWVTYSWTDSVTGIAYFIHECEVGK